MVRFVVRNYGVTRQVQYKGQQIIIANDRAIETDDIELAAVLQNMNAMHVTDRCPETPGPSLPPVVKIKDEQAPEEFQAPEVPDASAEIQYKDMKMLELQALGKDRQLKVSGLKKAALIQALNKYDVQEVPEEVAVA